MGADWDDDNGERSGAAYLFQIVPERSSATLALMAPVAALYSCLTLRIRSVANLPRCLFVALLIAAILPANAVTNRARAFDQLLVSHRGKGTIQRYDSDGTFLNEFGGPEPQDANGLELGPDGMLYVADEARNRVLRNDPASGDFLGVFASGGDSNSPSALTLAPMVTCLHAAVIPTR